MRSMTGFGRGTAERDGTRATVDIRSVNHRYFDLKLRGAPLPPAVEDALGKKLRDAIERGAVAVSVHVTRAASTTSRFDHDAARAAHHALADLASRLGLPGPDLALVLAQPGVVRAGDADDEPADATLAAAEAALVQLVAMRGKEGAVLATDIGARLDELAATRAAIATHAGTVSAQLQRRLHDRVAKLAVDVDPARLAQEVALLAERADISEELVRLASHLDQARALVAAPGGVGRRLDFLVQELGRELNTIGSKSALAEVTALVVDGKAALEKLREQVQNVE